MKTLSYPLLLSILVIFSWISSNGQDSIPNGFCLSNEEYKLYNLVNEYRSALNLNKLQLSKGLSYVAKLHAKDLAENRPDTSTCNFHSWSDKGNWTACCFEKEPDDSECMLKKPAEIITFTDDAFEVVYWENKEATANRAFDQWRGTPAARSILTNFKKWESYNWKSIGTGIYKGFAIIWLSEVYDQEKEVLLCEKDEVITFTPPKSIEEELVISEKTGRFYIIVGSLQTLEDAKEQVLDYQNEGFKRAKVINSDDKFRISISDYAEQDQALKAKKELPSKFSGAWIFPF